MQRPHPPIAIGGTRPTRSLLTAARFVQHWNSIVASPAKWRESRGILDVCCADLGRDPREIEASVNIIYEPLPGVDAYGEQAAAYFAAGVDIVIVNLRPPLDPSVLVPLADPLTPSR